MGKVRRFIGSNVLRLSLFDFGVTYLVMILSIVILQGLNIKIPYVNLLGIFFLVLVISSVKNIISTSVFLSDINDDNTIEKVHKGSLIIFLIICLVGFLIAVSVIYFGINYEYITKVDFENYAILKYSNIDQIGTIVVLIASIIIICFYVFAKYIVISLTYKYEDEHLKNYYFAALYPLAEIFIIIANIALVSMVLITLNEYVFNTQQIIYIYTLVFIYLGIMKAFIYYLNDTYQKNALANSEFADVGDSKKLDVFINMLFVLVITLQVFFINEKLINNENTLLVYSEPESYYEAIYNETLKNTEEMNYVYISDLMYSIYDQEYQIEVVNMIEEQLSSKQNFDNAQQMETIACIEQGLKQEEIDGQLSFEYEGELATSPLYKIDFDGEQIDKDLYVISTIGGLSSVEKASYSESEVIQAIQGSYKVSISERNGRSNYLSYDATITFTPGANGEVIYYNVKEINE